MSIKKFTTLTLVGFCAIILSACGPTTNPLTENSQSPAAQSGATSSGAQGANAVTITFSDTGVTPATSTVKSGGTITWVNNSSAEVRAASDPHPTHTDNRDITNGQGSIVLAPGASSTVTVTKTGTWGFHDHLKATTTGSVTVQ